MGCADVKIGSRVVVLQNSVENRLSKQVFSFDRVAAAGRKIFNLAGGPISY